MSPAKCDDAVYRKRCLESVHADLSLEDSSQYRVQQCCTRLQSPAPCGTKRHQRDQRVWPSSRGPPLSGTVLMLIAMSFVLPTAVRGAPSPKSRTPDRQTGFKPSTSSVLDLEWVNPMPKGDIEKSLTSLVEFDCTVQCRDANQNIPYHTIVWKKNGRRIPTNKRVKTKAMYLSIRDLRLHDQGKYTCEIELAEYQGHRMAWTFKLKVKVPELAAPVITLKPVNTTVAIGYPAMFNCSAYRKSGVKIKWIRHILINGSLGKGVGYDDDPHIEVLKPWEDASNKKLVINKVKKEDEGWYTCAVANPTGISYESAYLRVVQPLTGLHENSTDQGPYSGISMRTPRAMHENRADQVPFTMISIVSGIILFAIVVVISVAVYCYKKKKLELTRYQLYPKKEIFQRINSHEPLVKSRHTSSRSSTSSYHPSASSNSGQSVPYDDSWEFPRNRLIIQEIIGEGAFGVVKKALAYGIDRNSKATIVAVKTLKDNASHLEQLEFVKELEVMKSVKKMGWNKNIINFLGCCTQGGAVYVICEYAKKGNLRDYLVSLRSQVGNFTPWRGVEVSMDPSDGLASDLNGNNDWFQKQLFIFSHQIAKGMQFLAFHQCIHRDLAARNVLVTEDNTLKIADFGLARNGDYYKKMSGGQLPVKWMPPEALLHMKYTVKSDVWSFGVVLWEIFSLGGMPYPTIRHEDLYFKLVEGYRMERPHFAPKTLYSTMKECWNQFPEKRPDFNTLVLILERHLVRITSGGYIEVLPDDESADEVL